MDRSFPGTPGAASGTLLSLALATLALGSPGPSRVPGQHAAELPTDTRPRYSLRLRFDPSEALLTGTATVTPPPGYGTDGVARLAVSAAGSGALEVVGITGPDGRAASWSGPDADGVLTVRSPETADASRPLTIAYRLSAKGSGYRPFGYFVLEGISGWPYPRLVGDNGTAPDFADFDVELEHPASLAVLTTGGTGETLREGAVVRARYRADHVRGFAIVAGEGYRVERPEAGGTPVVAFFHPEQEERFRFAIERTKEAAAWYQRTYGFFPLDEVGIVQGHTRWSGGYPLPNMFALHLGSLDDEFLTWITAHELGHYYWGERVLADPRQRDWIGLDWLQLALGIWSDQLYLAERKGIPLPEQWRRSERQGDWFVDYLRAVIGKHEQRLDLTPAETSGLGFDYNSLIRHGKAATGVYLLSLQLGPERFLDLQRRLLEEYRYRPITSEELVEELAAAGLPEAEAFLDAWRRGDATIGVEVGAVEPQEDGDGWIVSLRRTGPVPYPVTVDVVTDAGTVRHVMEAAADRDSVRVPHRPLEVLLDPDGLIPMESSSHPEILALYRRAMDRAGSA